MVNRKSDNKQFEVHGEYLHLYDTLTEIINDEHTEYEGELYVVKTDLTEQVIENNYPVMLSFLKKIRGQKRKCEHTREIAQTYLEATDYISTKCYELGLSVEQEYPNEFALRQTARQIVRHGWCIK